VERGHDGARLVASKGLSAMTLAVAHSGCSTTRSASPPLARVRATRQGEGHCPAILVTRPACSRSTNR
jgi:hypothetical protein